MNAQVLLRETRVSIAINGEISIGFFFAVFGLKASSAGSSFGVDFLPQAFFVTLMGTLVPSLLIRRGSATAIAPVVPRSVVLAIAAAILARSGAWLIFAPVLTLADGPALGIKIAFAAILCAILTPYSVHRAMSAPVRNRP